MDKGWFMCKMILGIIDGESVNVVVCHAAQVWILRITI